MLLNIGITEFLSIESLKSTLVAECSPLALNLEENPLQEAYVWVEVSLHPLEDFCQAIGEKETCYRRDNPARYYEKDVSGVHHSHPSREP